MPRNRWNRCALCLGEEDVRLLDISTQGKTAYLGCAYCGYTWPTKSVARVSGLAVSTWREMREIRQSRRFAS